MPLSLGDERADALDPDQCSLVRQLAQRPVGSHPAHLQLGDQIVLGRHAEIGRPLAAFDAVEHHLLDAGIERSWVA